MAQFSLRSDVTQKVSERWKETEKKDIDDLLRCFLEYLKIRADSGEEYVFKIPYLGKMYQKIDNYQKQDTPTAIEMLKDITFNSRNFKTHPLYRKNTLYDIRTKGLDNIELMKLQNAIKED